MTQQNNKDIQNLLIWAAVLGGGYYFVVKPLLTKFGLMEQPLVSKTKEEAKTNIEKYVKDTTNKLQATKSLGEWTLVANQIYTDFDQPVWNNNSDGVRLLKMPMNDADVALLIQGFGTRSSHWFGIFSGAGRTLPEFLSEQATSSNINEINNAYAKKGITYRF
jgi:hypothetical protein